MKHYSRESERREARIIELERQKTKCEADLAAMEACWMQVKTHCSANVQSPTDHLKLIDVIGSLVQPQKLPPTLRDTRRTFPIRAPSVTSTHFFTDIFDLSCHVSKDSQAMSQLTEAFDEKLRATEELVSAFISVCREGNAGFQQEDLLSKYHAAQSEVRPTSSTPISWCLVIAYLGKEPSLATCSCAITALGSFDPKRTVPQRSRAGPITRRSAHQQDCSGYDILPRSQRRRRPTSRV